MARVPWSPEAQASQGSIDDWLEGVPARAPEASKSWRWSSYQEAIFTDATSGDGHTVVEARAGSGKTKTIVEITQRTRRDETLLTAFNTRITDELKRQAPRSADVLGLNSYGFRTLMRAFGRKFEVDRDRASKLARDLYKNAPGTYERRHAVVQGVKFAKATLAETADEVNRVVDAYGVDVPHANRAEYARDVLAVMAAARDLTQGVVDFDDQVWLPVVLGLRGKTYDRVLVDEAQDLTPAQAKLVLGAVTLAGRICVVGDSRQAIYAFRGADSASMAKLTSRLAARTLPLSVCYRCGSRIVDFARQWVPDLESFPGAPLGEVAHDVDEATLLRTASPGDFILSRTNAPLMRLCLGFLREGRRAVVLGRDVGASLSNFVRRCGVDLNDPRGVERFRVIVDEWLLSERLRLARMDPPGEVEPVEDRAACLHALSEGARTLSEVDVRITRLFDDNDESARITLSSTHKAKGLERGRAWLLWDTYRPGRGGQEENLAYVAATRAQRSLYLVRGVL